MNDEGWSIDDRAAARAFLQRCEVRLSTLHRVATALLSGAGLMVLLPAMVKDQIVTVLSALLTTDVSVPHVFLIVVALVTLAVPLGVLFLLLGDLTRFYFHAQHVSGLSDTAFAPRFTLTGLRLPAGDLSATGEADLAAARRDPPTLELLVPPNKGARAAIDRKLDAYGGLNRTDDPGDIGRVNGLLELVASRSRTLAEEIAKVELGMTRHLLRLQVIVLRYVKALLAFLTTALAVFAASAIVPGNPGLGTTRELLLAALFAVWAPAMVYAVASPVRWIAGLLSAEGATVNAVAADREFTRIEHIAVIAAAAVWTLSAATTAIILVADHPAAHSTITAITVTVAAGLGLVVATRRSLATQR